ncbi:MAG: tetratricopeptide repeat protein [Spirochaetota bacterium]|nr:MAG: tetratricopeptide repeat protein [Spirochaetota bacterium]
MKKYLYLFFIVLFLGSAWAGLAEVVILYESGECKVDLQGRGKWKDVAIDMKLNKNSVVRTGFDGEIELDIDGERISIGKNSEIVISGLLEKLGERKKLAWFSNLSPVIKNLIGVRSAHTETALMGVRGVAEEEEELDWMGELEEDDPRTMFESGKELYKDGDYGKAINLFKEIIDKEEVIPIKHEVSFYLGSSMFHTMQYDEALSYLKQSMERKDAYYYEIALLHYSFANYFSKDYKGAISGFSSYTQEFSDGTFAPYALLMLGKSHKAIGEKDEAKRYFQKIQTLYSNTDVYPDAMNEIKGL